MSQVLCPTCGEVIEDFDDGEDTTEYAAEDCDDCIAEAEALGMEEEE